jgi:hypothetical protein
MLQYGLPIYNKTHCSFRATHCIPTRKASRRPNKTTLFHFFFLFFFLTMKGVYGTLIINAALVHNYGKLFSLPAYFCLFHNTLFCPIYQQTTPTCCWPSPSHTPKWWAEWSGAAGHRSPAQCKMYGHTTHMHACKSIMTTSHTPNWWAE